MNFQDLYKKIRSIDENVEASVVAEPIPVDGAGDEGVGECGMMPPMGMMPPSAPPAQQDTVSMNVSMNAQGAGGIRDLMNVLKDIQDGPDHESGALTAEPNSVEIDADPELDIAMPSSHDEEEPDVQVVHLGHDDLEKDEAYDNEPDAQYQSQDYMHDTLSGNKQKMTPGGYNQSDNALTMAAILPVAAAMGRMGEGTEGGLSGKLQAMYEEVKLRETEKKTMSRAA
jgi:hypothetical protein